MAAPNTSAEAASAVTETEASPASEKVFDIPELLEHILSFLPFKDLLLTQRTSKQVKAAIESSLKLQQKLHLAPVRKGSSLTIVPIAPECVTVFDADETGPELYANCEVDWPCPPAGLETASWRNMYITQPPVLRAPVELCDYEDFWDQRGKDLVRKRGITLGSMVKHAFVEMERHSVFNDGGEAALTMHLGEDNLLG